MALSRREALILGGVAAAAALAGGLAGVLALQSGSGAAALLAASFPEASGRQRRLSEWQGKALLCNFWATWCAPCREEIPLLNAAQQRYRTRGLQVVGIAVDSAANVAQFEESIKIAYPVLVAGSSALALMSELGNGTGALPFTVLLDRHGRLAHRKLGAYSAAELERELAGFVQ